MKLNNILTLLCLFSGTVYAQKKDYPIQPVAFTQVHVNDQFWAPKMEDIIIAKNAEVTSHFNPDLLNGIEVLTVPGSGTHRKLNSNELIKVDQQVTAIPY